MNIIIIGMPASGKSCMGRTLAKPLKMKYIDTDRIIENKTGRKLQEIINEDGLDAFKRIEEEILCGVEGDNLIISTGGSAVYYERAMERFCSMGVVVYLYTSLETIVKRLGDFSKRGVVIKQGQTFEDLYRERCALYEKYADATINCDGHAYSRFHVRIEQTLRAFIDYC
jgi:shikimate kinase